MEKAWVIYFATKNINKIVLLTDAVAWMPKEKVQKKKSEIKLNNIFPYFPQASYNHSEWKGGAGKGVSFIPSLRQSTAYSVIAKIDTCVSNS